MDGKALDYIFYMQSGYKKKAFSYRVPIGDYNYLQCSVHYTSLHHGPDLEFKLTTQGVFVKNQVGKVC